MAILEQEIGELLKRKNLTLSLSESCTGGLLSHRITNVPESSTYFEGSVVCYSKQAIAKLLGIPGSLIERCGQVSSETAEAMAEAIRKLMESSIGMSVTGVAGPGQVETKPVGLVYIALCSKEATLKEEFRFSGSRENIKNLASDAALELLRRYLLS